MPSYELDGVLRAQLRDAVLLGFQTSGQLRRVVGALSRDMNKIVANAPYEEQVDELITVAYGEGWLINLCQELVRERQENPEVCDPILAVQLRLEERRAKHLGEWRQKDLGEVHDPDPRRAAIVLSSVDPDAAW